MNLRIPAASSVFVRVEYLTADTVTAQVVLEKPLSHPKLAE